MHLRLQAYVDELYQAREKISPERKEILQELVNYLNVTNDPKLHFICTHNSRRSHLSQIWAQTLASFFGVKVKTFSGGTEATAFHPNAVAAIERAGFEIEKEGEHNPRYSIFYSKDTEPMICYSKKFDEVPNPSSTFAAIMTCSEADAKCPVVFGADKRIKLFYEDPKIADGTLLEATTYDERCRQIATEMYFVFDSLR